MNELPIRCACGAFRGKAVDYDKVGSARFVCLCKDCQAYAHYLNRASDMLDANGGTEIFPMAPSHFRITTGREKLACVRLTEKGPLRWFTSCCRTPIANTAPTPKLPYIGIVDLAIDHAATGRTREQNLGPVYARLFGKYGIGKLPPGTKPKAPLYVVFWTFRFMGRGFWKKWNRANPFFDDAGQPIARPEMPSSTKHN